MTFQDQQLNSMTFQAWKMKFLNSMTFLVVSDLYEPCSVGLLALNQGTLVWKRHCQGRALRNIQVSLALRTKWCKIQGAQQMISMKNLTFSSHQGAKVRDQGSPGATRVQPWFVSGHPKLFNQAWIFQILFSIAFLLQLVNSYHLSFVKILKIW